MPKRTKNDPELGDTGLVVSIRDISEFIKQLEEEEDLTKSIAHLSDRLPELYKVQEDIHRKKVAQNRSHRRLKDFLIRADFLHAPGWEDRLVQFVRDMHRQMYEKLHAPLNALEIIKQEIERSLPTAWPRIRRPKDPQGQWWLDVLWNNVHVTVEWRPGSPFGISTLEEGDGYGEKPQEIVTDPRDVPRAVQHRLSRGPKRQDELIKETHRWKEAERQSDERAKAAESKLQIAEANIAILKRLLAVPDPVRNATGNLRNFVSAGLIDNTPSAKAATESLLLYMEAVLRQADKKPLQVEGYEVKSIKDPP